MRNLFFPGCGIAVSAFLIFVGAFFLFVFPPIFQFFVNKEFRLSPSSQSFKHWRKTPLPVIFDLYLFNWTNPEKFDKEKPSFTELGPYRFYESREKVNLTWHPNGTLSYRQLRSWTFAPSESTGSLEDNITTLNGVTLTAAYNMRHAGILAKKSLNMAFRFTEQRVWVTHSARDLLFEGYSDHLMTLASLSPAFTPVASPFDKFAWFYQRNSSYTFDGWFNLDTGLKNMSGLGSVKGWNHRNHSGFYSGRCGDVVGFTGDLFPPGMMQRATQFEIFSQDLCRTLPLTYSRDAEVRGIAALQYAARLRWTEPGSAGPEDPDGCCNGECVPGGFLNLTACRFGAPVFVSFPHFYEAKPLYLNLVDGMRPDPQRHRFFFSVEPTFGIPLDVGARVQLNMYMQPIPYITMYESAPRLMFPVLWADQRVTITEPLARELRLVILLPTIALVTGVIALSAGTALFMLTILLRARSARRKHNEHIKSPAPDTVASPAALATSPL